MESAEPIELDRRGATLARLAQGALLAIGWGLCFAVAFMRRSIVIVRAGNPSPFDRFFEDQWLLLAAGGSLPCLAVAVWLLVGAGPSPRPPGPKNWAAALARGVALCGLLSGALALYLVCGGHDILYGYGWTPVGNAALVAPLLGLLSLVETRRAETARARVGWSLLAGVGAFVALLLAWIQREYANELFVRGLDVATQHVLYQLQWLSVDPLWTVLHFAWIALPIGALTFARLRPRRQRIEFALALSGAVLPWLIGYVPFADAVITTSCAMLCVLVPLAWALGDRLHAKAVALVVGEEEG